MGIPSGTLTAARYAATTLQRRRDPPRPDDMRAMEDGLSSAIHTASAVASLALAMAVLTACSAGPSAPPADAATVMLVVAGDNVVGADSRLACILRTVPAADAGRVGEVADCTNLIDDPAELQLVLAPGTYTLQVGRFACPGMPGECSQDAYAEQYDDGDGAVWSCEVSVDLSPREKRWIQVNVASEPAAASCAARR